jgi:hypothetical protein
MVLLIWPRGWGVASEVLPMAFTLKARTVAEVNLLKPKSLILCYLLAHSVHRPKTLSIHFRNCEDKGFTRLDGLSISISKVAIVQFL